MQEVFPNSVRRSWQPTISVVVPAYNEVSGLDFFHRRLLTALAGLESWEVVYVNDGSTDDTLSVTEALHRTDDCVGLVSLSRNFGKEIATTAGLIIGNPVAGYSSLMSVVLFFGGVQLMFLGAIGEYLRRVFNETKQRPLYLVERYIPSAVKVSV
jgi:glycosyltransferase involved in cell wall biosynthesis